MAAATAIGVGVALFFVSPSELWLDEVLSVNIAKLPLPQLFEALRHDGSPPLYYLLLHAWVAVFGDGNLAVRSLSGLFAVASLPLMWMAGCRIGGTRTASAGVLLLASSPFTVRYASETRMYTLLVFLSLLGALALTGVLRRPAPLRMVALSVVSGLLALTHYWAFYLIGATLVVLAARALFSGGAQRRATIAATAAVCAGGLVFAPWVGSFVFQLRHTATPWAPPARLSNAFDSVAEFAGGNTGAGRALFLVLLGLAALGLFGRAVDERHVALDLRTRRPGRGVAAVTSITLVLGLTVGLVVGTAFAPRYAAVVLAPFLLLAALGSTVLLDRRLRYGVLAVAVALGLFRGWDYTGHQRTQAGVIAAALRARATPGDVIAYCPDQLGPAVSRLLPSGFQQVVFPSGGSPERVDWVNYARRHRSSDPTRFAEMLDRDAGERHDVWMVWAPGYRAVGNRCTVVDRQLGAMRPGARLAVFYRSDKYGEAAYLVRYPPACRRPLAQRHQTPAPGCPVLDQFPLR